MNLNSPITNLFGIGKIQAARLLKLGIKKISDLIFYFPFSYQDRRKITPLSNIKIGNFYVIKIKIKSIKNVRVWRRGMGITEAGIEDESGHAKVIWFNQPFLTKNLKAGDEVLLFGKYIKKKSAKYFSSPEYEKVFGRDLKKTLHIGRIVPIYPLTKGITLKMMRRFISEALKKCLFQIKEFLPEDILQKEKLAGLQKMLQNIHFPPDEMKEEEARERASFNELFLVQLSVLSNRKKWREREAWPIKYDKKIAEKFYKSLPYEFTSDQKKSTLEIINDLQKGRPMNRLLDGDVGSGKTAIAIFALIETFKNGFQSAFMVPTEVLAFQHFKTLSENLKIFPIKIAILTRSERKIIFKGKIEKIPHKKILEKIEKGEIDVLVGTHALIQEKIKFKNLAFTIVDEQHRFGVKQRALLQNKNIPVPHLLSMTATPIPRTLALTVYGDLDISLIKEMPPGRKKIKTILITKGERYKAYQKIEKEVKKGRQVFVICPLIEAPLIRADENRIEARSVKLEYEKLKKDIFPEFRIGMLHGKMKAAEKEQIMEDFKNLSTPLGAGRKIDILVSTSVIEVGIDIQNATIIMIENAERFGLAQIHQFRGRVGRGRHQSFCFLFTESENEETLKRLKAAQESADGFALAEKDMEIRGPGEIYGVRQSGMPDFKIASLTDLIMIKRTKKAASEILEKDPEVKKHPALAEKLKEFETSIHLE